MVAQSQPQLVCTHITRTRTRNVRGLAIGARRDLELAHGFFSCLLSLTLQEGSNSLTLFHRLSSRLPSRLRIPSRLSSRLPSRLPSRLSSRLSSQLTGGFESTAMASRSGLRSASRTLLDLSGTSTMDVDEAKAITVSNNKGCAHNQQSAALRDRVVRVESRIAVCRCVRASLSSTLPLCSRARLRCRRRSRRSAGESGEFTSCTR